MLRSVCVAILLLVLPPVHAQHGSGTSVLPPGYPSRAADLDVLPGFRTPPPGYGEVAFYWWLGDTLTRERIAWQMDQLAGRGVTGLQINYAHSDAGGFSYGHTFKSQPALFSEEWWELFRWFLAEARERGMSVSLSDYTLCRPGQGWYVDEILAANPDMGGTSLAVTERLVDGGTAVRLEVPARPLAARAIRTGSREGAVPESRDLLQHISGTVLDWRPPAGSWKILIVSAAPVPASYDPMHPLSGQRYVETFFQRFEDRCPGEAGKGLNFFFSDELDFGIRGFLWNGSFAQEFRKRKGYDVVPELPALFADMGPRTAKIRMDYNDVLVALSEERFFKPLYDWHTDRGMLFGCDHGGRGKDVTEFGDYFRTQRWLSGPGCDQPELMKDVVKNKVASSIAHLYERPRTWLEGFHSSNWGTSSAGVADAIFANYAMGQNLLSLHGLYYSTHGGWWEWAPPDNHFRQPYWEDMTGLLRCTERLSYLLSQGVHRCDVAVLYPVAPMEAGLGGEEAVRTAFDLGPLLADAGIDFDYMDFESLARATVKDRALHVAGERYRILVLPAMHAVRFSTMEKARAFARAGGVVIAVGALPRASERVGAQDARLDRMVRDVFGMTAADITPAFAPTGAHPPGKAPGVYVRTVAEAVAAIAKAGPHDPLILTPDAPKGTILHRKAGEREIYFLHGVRKGTEIRFLAQGKAELWDPWDGSVRALPVITSDANGTRLRTPLTEHDPQIIVFSPGTPERVAATPATGRRASAIPLNGEWDFTLIPTLDNRWGDYRLPATDERIGAEATTLWYVQRRDTTMSAPSLKEEDGAIRVRPTFGPQAWVLGPLPSHAAGAAPAFHAEQAAGMPASVMFAGTEYRWAAYEFSWRWGVNGYPGHQGYHGLKGVVHDDLFEFGKIIEEWRGMPGTRLEQDTGSVYYVRSVLVAPADMLAGVNAGGTRPSHIWINGQHVAPGQDVVPLTRGHNQLLLRYEGATRGWFVLEDPARAGGHAPRVPLASGWYTRKDIVPYDAFAGATPSVGWYRCTAPPGLQSLRFGAIGEVRVYVDGAPVPVTVAPPQAGEDVRTGARFWQASLPVARSRSASVVLRIVHESGSYGGAALTGPVRFTCGTGLIRAGDLASDAALGTYAGGMRYACDVDLPQDQVDAGDLVLDLGHLVSSARVTLNGRPLGVRSAPPWEFDLAGAAKAGRNRIEITIHTTLGPFYRTTPSRYVGRTTSGLIGPVVIRSGG